MSKSIASVTLGLLVFAPTAMASPLSHPAPLRTDCGYALRALGVNSQPVAGGRAAAWIETLTDTEERRAVSDNRLGIQRIELLSQNVLQITVGDSFDTSRFDGHPECIL